jgi:hypothetical protein
MTGGVLASDAYIDASKVPANGIYSKGDVVVGTGRISAPTSTYHYIDLGRDGSDRQIFGSYGGVYSFRNSSSGADVVNIDNGSISCSGSIVASGNVTAYSDKRVKKNVKPIKDALAKVLSLKGVIFDRKDVNASQTGLIAQDVEAVLPEAVSRLAPSKEAKKFIKDGEILAVSYGSLAGLFVEAFKDLTNKLQEQAKLIDKQGLLIENLIAKSKS